jgi:methanogenic corrinoid protein MtbC1
VKGSETSLDELIVRMDERGAMAAIRRRLEDGERPAALLGECRLGMERVGTLFEDGVYFISALIMAGEIFREAAHVLVPRRQTVTRTPSGRKMVIATVRGDIHDIGKNIVIALFETAGLEMVDLGVNVPPEKIAEAIEAERPDVLGLSCVLTTGFDNMKRTVALVREQSSSWKRRLPIVIGGAPVNQTTSDKVGADGWCDDATRGLDLVRALLA